MCCNILQQRRAASTSLRTRSSASTAKSSLFVSFPSPPLSFYSFCSFPSSSMSADSPASPGSMPAGVPLDCSSPRPSSPDALCGSSSLISLSSLSSSFSDLLASSSSASSPPPASLRRRSAPCPFSPSGPLQVPEDRAAPPPLPQVVQVHEEGELLPIPVPHQLRILHRAPPPPVIRRPLVLQVGPVERPPPPCDVVDSSMLGPAPARPVARPCRPPPRSTTSIDSPSPARGASPGDRSRLPPGRPHQQRPCLAFLAPRPFPRAAHAL